MPSKKPRQTIEVYMARTKKSDTAVFVIAWKWAHCATMIDSSEMRDILADRDHYRKTGFKQDYIIQFEDNETETYLPEMPLRAFNVINRQFR